MLRITFYTIIFLAILFAGSIFITTPSVKSIFLLFSLFFLLIVTVFDLRFGALVLAGLVPSLGIIRWSDLDNKIAAAYTSAALILLLFAFFLKLFAKNDNLSIDKILIKKLFLLGGFLAFIIYHSAHYFNSPFIFIMVIKEYFLPFLSFFIFYDVLKNNLSFSFSLINILFWVTVLVSIINLFHYFIGLNIDLERFVLTYEEVSVPEVRDFGFGPMRRAYPILGLGGAGGGSAFYVIIGMLGFILAARHNVVIPKLFLMTGSFLLLVTSFFTLSLSGVFVVFIFFVFIFLWKTSNVLRIFVVSIACMFGLVIAMVPITIGPYKSILEYGISAFIVPTFLIAKEFSVANIFFGNGLGLTGSIGLQENLRLPGLFDRWILGAFLQLGVFGFLFMLLFWLGMIVSSFNGRGAEKDFSLLLFASGFILFGSFGYTHGSALMHRLFVPILMLSVAIIISFKKHSLKN